TRAESRRDRQSRVQSGLAYRDRSAVPAHCLRGDRAGRARAHRKPRRPHAQRLPRLGREAGARANRDQEGRGADGGAARNPAADSRRSHEPHSGRQVMAEQRRLRLFRGTRERGELKEYSVAAGEGMVVLDAVDMIQAEQAPDLAVRWNCKAGKCGSCSAEINGKPKLMCMTRMSDYAPDETITVAPMRAFPVIKDLVTDVSWNYEVNRK